MKKLVLAALTVVLLALASWFILAPKSQSLPPPVTLPDGTSLRILAVTYGTNHVIGSKLARATARLPSGLQGILKRFFGQRAIPVQTTTTQTPELLVWVDHWTNSTGATIPGTAYFTAVLGDGSNFISGPDAFLSSFPGSPQVQPLHFKVFPHRDRQLTLNIFHHDTKGGVLICNSLSFANPLLYQKYPQWQAEPLPATKRAGDLEVTLRGFETGHGSSRHDGGNQTEMNLKLRPLVNTNEIWQVCGVEVSDATGNDTHNSGSSSWGGIPAAFNFTPGLWPTEAAWKIKAEIKRSEGFHPEEIFMFKDVPLGALNRTNTIAWTTNVAGLSVTLQHIYRRAPLTNNSWSSGLVSEVHITYTPLPAGTQLDLLRMVCDNGHTNKTGSWGSSNYGRDYNFLDIPLDAQTADFTFAVQQSRTVEFTVKPQLPEVKARK